MNDIVREFIYGLSRNPMVTIAIYGAVLIFGLFILVAAIGGLLYMVGMIITPFIWVSEKIHRKVKPCVTR